MALIETHFFSEVLGMEMTVNVVLPQEKSPYSGDGKLKVLWLLHGGSGDESAWLRMGNAERYAMEYGLALIVPGGLNSCFTDMAHGGRFLTYLTVELPRILRHMFPRLSEAREDNLISGFSNGGYGCLKAGLARPDVFGAIGAFSAGDKTDVAFINDGSRKAKDRIHLFGDGNMRGTENDLQYLGREALKKDIPLPKVYHACGSLDPWLDLNEIVRDFFQGLEGNPYQYEYHQAEGYGHTWEFWEMELGRFLGWLGLEKSGSRYIGI
ncbi:alpha/beta hydrolase family protein [Paenibacillus sp. 32352]|uniref:alpha/beta hydrolase n=1 Tax=Paenibacillus sp. 32352 TaxID=1969111 RepID=UPI0009AC7CA9|nr:alpha/beta hydrolase-fold protein [Paenibacillus sp. 32352]